MKTISAKELRLNLGKVVARTTTGENIAVTYRNKPVFTIVPHVSPGPTKRLAGLEALKKAKKIRPISLDPNKSIKELYNESLAKKYGTVK